MSTAASNAGSSVQHNGKLEADLWKAADNLRANSKLTSSDFFLPVLGVIFLRHAANRFEAASRQIEEDRTAGRMPPRKVVPEDYLRRRALWLPEAARYDRIMERAATRGADLAGLVGYRPRDFGCGVASSNAVGRIGHGRIPARWIGDGRYAAQ